MPPLSACAITSTGRRFYWLFQQPFFSTADVYLDKSVKYFIFIFWFLQLWGSSGAADNGQRNVLENQHFSVASIDGSVYSKVFTTLGVESKRKSQKSKNNTISDYPSVQKTENPLFEKLFYFYSYIVGVRTSDGKVVGQSFIIGLSDTQKFFLDSDFRYKVTTMK